MLAAKGGGPVATSARRSDLWLWLVSVLLIAGIVAVGIIYDRNSPSHVPSPVGARLVAAAIVTVAVAVAKAVGGPRAAAATGVIGTLVAVVLLVQVG